MKKLVIALFIFSALLISITSIAQDKTPVQFDFKAERINDSLAKLVINAKMDKTVQLFSVKQRGADDPFVSSLHLDSSAAYLLRTTDTSTENGQLQLVKEAPGAASSYRLFADSVQFEWLLHTKNTDSLVFKGSLSWLAKKEAEFPSGEANFTLKIPAANTLAALPASAESEESLWSIFLICLGTGLLAVITPCVFPLIPVTVSFFLKRSKSRAEGIRNAVWYSISIIAIYTIPTLLLTLAFGGKILYTISTSAVSNILFFAIFLVFAISFFGAFELTLPNSWANKADEKAGKGGLMGIFFMALTLVIVSFSCTGPLVGTLLGQTSTNGVGSAPIIGMFGFGVGLALPFSLFAFFPSMLQSLPKSGGWLNSVKVTFGFIELALAMKFLSNVDLAYHWHLLDRDVFLVIWIVIFTLMGMYLLGKLKFSHDSDLPFISVPRLFFAIFSFCFALYMVPGLWGAPLKLLSGFIPPASTQEFNLEDLEYKLDNAHLMSGADTSKSATNNSSAQPPKKYTDILEVPYGLIAYFDLDEGMAAAKALNKPVMLDFTGHSCANCRKMEQEVWKNPEVLKLIREEFVLVSLYVDESKELPLEEQHTAPNGDRIETVGHKNLEYETTKFGFNAQPLYKFLDLKGNPLSDVNYGYDPDVDKFIQHLKGVIQKFKSQK
ncbi:MAG TPA: thioredoxin family protein [Sediminibacterium sp.]|nr:thioredoxin family protein [Sediminibacterium sp.]HQS53933.1 thioredoxin family protein [Sediminibacterium sp.]